jgi:putative transposase
VRVRTSRTQDRQLLVLSYLVRLGFNFAHDNRKKLWDAEQRFQSNRDLEQRLAEVPSLAARARNVTLSDLIQSDEGRAVCGQQVAVGVERCRDAFWRYSNSHSSKARRPRRKDKSEYPSVQFPASKCVLGVGFVQVPVVGVLKSSIKSHDFSGDFAAKTLVIKRVVSGEWDISVAYDAPKPQITERGSGVIGIDINCSNTCGVWYIAADGEEDGWVEELPDTNKADRDIAFYKSQLERAQYGGKRRQVIQERIDTAKRHRANIIKEHHLRLLRLVLSLCPEVVVFEEMDLRDEGYHGWKKVAVNQLRRALIDRDRAADNGCRVVTVNRAYTTMTCSDCGHVQRMPSDVREYGCPECGMTMDRDLNSARNIARKYLQSVQPSMAGTARR